MNGISVNSLSASIQSLAPSIRSYRSGGSGKDGTCDCIGLIIGGLRGCGYNWPGTHGSNYAYRYRLTRHTSDMTKLEPGMVVFKYRNPGDDGYSLPNRYRSGTDTRDYYHIGYVLSVSPLQIIHCTTPGPILRDSKIGKWRIAGWLDMVDYTDSPMSTDDQEVVVNMTAVITSNNGKGANMRAKASKQSALVDQIPEGAAVDVLEYGTEYSKVQYEKKTGYVLTYLLKDGEADPVDTSTGEGLISIPDEAARAIYEAYAAAHGLGVG